MMTEIKLKMDTGVEFNFDALKVDKKTELKQMEEQIIAVGNMSSQLHKDMSDLRKTGSEEQDISSATTTRVIVFGVISVGIIISSAVVQILYLRRFFREKKIM